MNDYELLDPFVRLSSSPAILAITIADNALGRKAYGTWCSPIELTPYINISEKPKFIACSVTKLVTA